MLPKNVLSYAPAAPNRRLSVSLAVFLTHGILLGILIARWTIACARWGAGQPELNIVCHSGDWSIFTTFAPLGEVRGDPMFPAAPSATTSPVLPTPSTGVRDVVWVVQIPGFGADHVERDDGTWTVGVSLRYSGLVALTLVASYPWMVAVARESPRRRRFQRG